MLEFLDSLDKQIFLSINGCHSSFTDPIWVFISSKLFWFTLYIPILILVLRKYRTRAFEIIAFAAMLYLITDQGANFAKHYFERFRPCRDPDFSSQVHLLRDCSKYGFFSGHASNAFGQVVFLILLKLIPQKGPQKILAVSLILWASIVALSRVFVGVHYPFDVLAGAIYGTMCGFLVFYLRKLILGKMKVETS